MRKTTTMVAAELGCERRSHHGDGIIHRDDAMSATGRGTMNSTIRDIKKTELFTAKGAKSAKRKAMKFRKEQCEVGRARQLEDNRTCIAMAARCSGSRSRA